MKRRFTAPALLALLLVPALAGAQPKTDEPEPDYRQRVIIGAGATFPQAAHRFREFAKPGPAFDIEYLVYVVPTFALGAELAWEDLSDKTVETADGFRQKTHSSASQALVLMRWEPMPEKRFSPYGTFGFGTSSFHKSVNSTPIAGTTWADTGTAEDRQIFSKGSTEPGMRLGAGVSTSFNSRVFGALEGDWRLLGVDSNKFGQRSYQVVDAGLHVGCRF
jgi:opacity protein-like surface antigen